MSLTTFRKNGEAVPTPVWFAQSDDKIYVITFAASGKLKRIRQNAQVEVAPCDINGKVLGGLHEGMARLLPADEFPVGNHALSKKYRLAYHLFKLYWMATRKYPVFLEITPM